MDKKGQCILVHADPTKKALRFSMKGDSGSLVVRHIEGGKTEAIGIISKWLESWKNKEGQVYFDLAMVVMLSNCFKAVDEELGLSLTLCAKWEDCDVKPFE